ncbi:MAG: FAD-dependent oxidoreductase, partial [Thermoplasmata archaeon]
MAVETSGPREYDLIAVGTGSVMYVVEPYLERNPGARAAVIDQDEPGGICLTRGCIPSKMLVYPATLRRLAERAPGMGIDLRLHGIDFRRVMDRMRRAIRSDIDEIRRDLSTAPNIDYFEGTAEFVEPGTLRVGNARLRSRRILLGTGSRPRIPSLPGLREAGYLTSDSVLEMNELPASLVILGGGFIAAEYAHFFSAMGSRVTIVGRNARILPGEEPEISELVERAMRRYLTVRTGQEAVRVLGRAGAIRVEVRERASGACSEVESEQILVAVGREPNNDLLQPQRAGVALDEGGWIRVDDHLRTSSPGVWALGDATGGPLFKHRANQDAALIEENLVRGGNRATDYHAVPHAVFTDPEVASVGWTEREAIDRLGVEQLLVCRYTFEKTAKARAMY